MQLDYLITFKNYISLPLIRSKLLLDKWPGERRIKKGAPVTIVLKHTKTCATIKKRAGRTFQSQKAVCKKLAEKYAN